MVSPLPGVVGVVQEVVGGEGLVGRQAEVVGGQHELALALAVGIEAYDHDDQVVPGGLAVGDQVRVLRVEEPNRPHLLQGGVFVA